MIEVHLLIPVTDNAGVTFDPLLDDQFLLELDLLLAVLPDCRG